MIIDADTNKFAEKEEDLGQIINRDAHVEKCAAEATSRRRITLSSSSPSP